MQERAANIGYDWPTVEGVLDKVPRSSAELASRDHAAEQTEEYGDLLFVLVNVARWQGIEAEAALRGANDKFRRRFASVERQAAERGVALRTSRSRSSTRCGTRRRPKRRSSRPDETIGNRHRPRPGRRPRPDAAPARSASPLGVQKWAEGSCLVRFGDTQVLCAATIADRVPPHLRGKGTGWVTAEYSMLPRATAERTDRESVKGKLGGRTHEIQRLIGRSLRDAVDLTRLGERTITIDCDVLQADGGTRTASITGGYVALAAAMITYGMDRHLVGRVAAISVGLVDGEALLDLDYSEDSRADVDFNVVGTDAGHVRRGPGHGRGQAVRPGGDGRPDRPRLVGPRAAVRGAGRDPRHRQAVSARRRPAAAPRRDPLGPQARRAAGRCSRLEHAELVSLDDLGHPRRSRRDRRRRSRRTPGSRPASRPGATGLPTLADDSGLEVDALGGGPGVRTRRYAGPSTRPTPTTTRSCSPRSTGCRPERRGARYVCVLALALPGPAPGPAARSRCALVRGTCRGRIATRAARDRRLRLRPDLRAGAASRPAAGRSASGRPRRSTRSRIAAGRPGG